MAPSCPRPRRWLSATGRSTVEVAGGSSAPPTPAPSEPCPRGPAAACPGESGSSLTRQRSRSVPPDRWPGGQDGVVAVPTPAGHRRGVLTEWPALWRLKGPAQAIVRRSGTNERATSKERRASGGGKVGRQVPPRRIDRLQSAIPRRPRVEEATSGAVGLQWRVIRARD
jgi:hypothetical protein